MDRSSGKASAGVDELLVGLPSTFTLRAALAAGMSKHRFYLLRDAGAIEALAHGLYRRPTDSEEFPDLDLLEIALRAPQSTLCLTSALVHHELTDANPASIDVALPKNTRRPRTHGSVTWHMFDPATFEIGRDLMTVDSQVSIGIYTAQRCIIDAFRLRHREGEDLAYIALRRWLRHPGNHPTALMELSRHFPTVVKPLRQALEIFQHQ